MTKTVQTVRQAGRAVWQSVQSPRRFTVIYIVGYGLAVLLGFSRFVSPPVTTTLDQVARIGEALFLIYGGTVGMPSAWKGAQWLERSGAASVVGGLVLVAFNMVTHVVGGAGLTAPWVTILALSLSALGVLVRYLQVKDEPYAVGCGPLRPAEQAAVNDVLTDNDMARRLDPGN